MQNLVKNGIITSNKGMNGGFNLSGDPEEILLKDIVHAIDGDSFLTQCVLGFPKCGDNNPCPVHDQWLKSKEIILGILYGKNLGELSQKLDTKLNFINTLIDRCYEDKPNIRVDLNTCC